MVVLFLFILLILTLGIMNSCLLVTNHSYRRQNRELIIQNDSILSINIKLKEDLKFFRQAAFTQKRD
jgi:hypothetical protein